MFFYKRKRHKKKKNREKWSPDPTSGSTKKRFYLTPSETEFMYSQVRKNLSTNVIIKNY